MLMPKVIAAIISISKAIVSMEALPFEDNSFDCVLCYNVIYHAGRAGVIKTLTELKRVLKPGGELFLTMLSKKSDGFLRAQSDSGLTKTPLSGTIARKQSAVSHTSIWNIRNWQNFLKGGKLKAFHRNAVSISKENVKKTAGTGNFCLKT